MGSSKTAQVLITKFNYEERNMKVWLIKPAIDNRDGEKIITAAEAEGLTVAPLSSGKLHDLGGILFINVD